MHVQIIRMLAASACLACGLATVPRAAAAIPLLNGSCPGGIEVHADEGGPVYVNGREAGLKRFSDTYYEASDAPSGVTLSLSIAADGTPQMSYTGKGGRNGVCQLGSTEAGVPLPASPHPHHAPAQAAVDSPLAACDARKGGQGRLVTQLPVGDTHTEVIVDYDDGRYLCMVTNEGEVSSLGALRRR